MTTLTEIRIENLKSFENNPFIFREDTAFDMLIDSISNLGVLIPIIVRSLDDENYEIISGHRRAEACRRLGIETIPCIVKELTRDEATVILVDLNLQRDEVLPSEKAHAYKMKMDALKNQGARTDLTSTQSVSKFRTAEEVGKENNESRETVRRYIRLTYLIPEILKLVDEGRIAFTPAVELSFLSLEEQHEVYGFYENEEVTPSYSQTVRMKKLHAEGQLTSDRIAEIMAEAKANQKDFLKIPTENINKYFKSRFTEKQKQEFVIKAVEHYHRYLMRQRDAR
ncbi:MAG: ParB/RepB/Spo0J family partition protein [Clostridia bacterium]|nr:ParB/RepB/Spo0J family partition protein [Clostridia bacterium]